MIDIPAIGGDISVMEGLAAASLLAIGYVLHELMHVVPLEIFGIPYEIHTLPPDSDKSRLKALLFGTAIEVEMLGSPRRMPVVVSALAPTIMALAPLTGIALALSYPVVDIGTMLVLGVWFAVSIPSPQDWMMALSYRPDKGIPTEVSTNGS